MNDRELREKVLKVLREQGINGCRVRSKEEYKKLQEKARLRELLKRREFLLENFKVAEFYLRDGKSINPEKIELELRLVQREEEEILFKWWSLVWWSIPYQPSIGRRLKFLLWDKTHNAPFGLILLQSPILKLSVRDKFLGVSQEELDFWVNQSLYAQRVGALPPYNELLGGKMVALTLIANEVRDIYRRKYENTKTFLKGREIPAELLFITTTSAFGKSSIYNRLKYKGELVALPLGYTAGYGTFHIPDELYNELVEFLKEKGIDVKRGFGAGPSRKLRLLSKAVSFLGLPDVTLHNLQREVYLFPLVKNLHKVIHEKEDPVYRDAPFKELFEFWKERWALPRAMRVSRWQEFKAREFLKEVRKMLVENENERHDFWLLDANIG